MDYSCFVLKSNLLEPNFRIFSTALLAQLPQKKQKFHFSFRVLYSIIAMGKPCPHNFTTESMLSCFFGPDIFLIN